MSTVAGLEANTLADGFFHVATWIFVAAGSFLTVREWRAGRIAPPWRAHIGALLLGWGAFNVVEGLIDHELLGIHHVRDDLGGPIGWDLAFLAFGALLVVIGIALTRGAPARAPATGRPADGRFAGTAADRDAAATSRYR
jgi:uncharacterized membrane protein